MKWLATGEPKIDVRWVSACVLSRFFPCSVCGRFSVSPHMPCHVFFRVSSLVSGRVIWLPAQVCEVALDEIKAPPPKVKEIRTVEASLRIDAVASAGFSVSRGKVRRSTGSPERASSQSFVADDVPKNTERDSLFKELRARRHPKQRTTK